jgi:hypothetical protein
VLVAAIQASQNYGLREELLTAATLTKHAAGAVIDGHTRDRPPSQPATSPRFTTDEVISRIGRKGATRRGSTAPSPRERENPRMRGFQNAPVRIRT